VNVRAKTRLYRASPMLLAKQQVHMYISTPQWGMGALKNPRYQLTTDLLVSRSIVNALVLLLVRVRSRSLGRNSNGKIVGPLISARRVDVEPQVPNIGEQFHNAHRGGSVPAPEQHQRQSSREYKSQKGPPRPHHPKCGPRRCPIQDVVPVILPRGTDQQQPFRDRTVVRVQLVL
jgi:hypothetical protein